MPVGEVFESPFTVEERFVSCGEGFDHGHEMAVVVHELQFNGSQMAGVAGDGQCGVSLIAGSFDQRLKAEAFNLCVTVLRSQPSVFAVACMSKLC